MGRRSREPRRVRAPGATRAAAGGGLGLFGPLGVLFATPLALVILTVVTMLYRQDVLKDPTAEVPGQKAEE